MSAFKVIFTVFSLIPRVVLTFLACFAGEGLKVLACIQNKSSREIKPKYCVYRKHSFFAQGRRRVHTKDLLKEVGEPIPSSANEKVTKVINIPHDTEPSIHNCSIIKAEYRLRVSLYDLETGDKENQNMNLKVHAVERIGNLTQLINTIRNDWLNDISKYRKRSKATVLIASAHLCFQNLIEFKNFNRKELYFWSKI